MATATRPPTSDARRGLALGTLLTGQAMASIDSSIVSVATPAIRTGLQASDAEIQLAVSGYLLTTGVLFVTCARIGDIIGHRRAYLIGLAWFTGASLVCGLSVSPAMLIVARIAQAVGAALLMPQVFSIIHREWEGPPRRRAIGLYSMVLALGVAVGQVCGGLVVGTDLLGLSWRPVFLINIPIGIVALVIGLRRLPRSQSAGHARLDLVGVALLTVAMTAGTLPLVFGPARGWPMWCWVLLGTGVVVGWLFVRQEVSARHPVLDLEVLRSREVPWGLVACCVLMGCYTVFLLTLTIHLQSELGFEPLRAGLTFVPYAIGFGAVSLGWSWCPNRVQLLLPSVGPLVCAAGLVLAVLVLRIGSPAGALPLLLFAGAGHAAGYSPLIASITTGVGPRLASAVSALNSTGPVLAEVVAVAGLGSVYFASSTSELGLWRVTVAVAVLLVVTTWCATMAVRIHRRRLGAG